MHRHEVEPDDLARRTSIRHQDGAPLTPVPPDAKAVFFGASYHADYATLLAAPGDLAAVAEATADYLAHGGDPHHPRHGTRSTSAGSAAATRRPTRWPRPSGAASATAAGR